MTDTADTGTVTTGEPVNEYGLAQPLAPPEPVSIPAGDFAVICDMRRRVADALAHFNTSNEETKSRRKEYEAARQNFERTFDRLVAKTQGEDLPLFNQTDMNEKRIKETNAAHLAKRLLDVGKIDLAPIIVAGWTDDEAMAIEGWLDDIENLEEGQTVPDPPPFLMKPTEKADPTAL